MSNDHYQELKRLKGLSTVPSVQKVLDDLINNHNKDVREPIKRSKAELQTVYITTGYAWSQSADSVTYHLCDNEEWEPIAKKTSIFCRLYINFKDSNGLSNDNCSLILFSKSIELNISNHNGANYKFKISQLYHHVDPEKSIIKFKNGKIVITLAKETVGKEWPELRMRSVQSIYNELERNEKKTESTSKHKFDTPFKEDGACYYHGNK